MERDELLAMGIEEAAVEKIIEEEERVRADYESRINQIERNFEIDRLLESSGARNIKAVKALIGDGDIETIRGEINRLKNDEETKFLFEKRGSFAPKRSSERLPDVKKNDYEARLKDARKSGNTVEAIRIKQQAASEGIMLL